MYVQPENYGVEMCIRQEHIIYAFKGCYIYHSRMIFYRNSCWNVSFEKEKKVAEREIAKIRNVTDMMLRIVVALDILKHGKTSSHFTLVSWNKYASLTLCMGINADSFYHDKNSAVAAVAVPPAAAAAAVVLYI